jgi:hypothetical protein
MPDDDCQYRLATTEDYSLEFESYEHNDYSSNCYAQ